jgi:hypothetical protein
MVVRLEIFVDPQQLVGTIYKAGGWLFAGDTKPKAFLVPGQAAAPRHGR